MATPPELVGRQAELERLRDSLDEARRGSGSLVLVAGEAGIGKTRLAEETARGTDALVLWGRATQAAPLRPDRRRAARLSAIEPRRTRRLRPAPIPLALIVPEVGEPAPASDPSTLFEAVRCAFEHIAERPCVLAVLDDLQWSDEATLDLLGALAEPLRRLRCCSSAPTGRMGCRGITCCVAFGTSSGAAASSTSWRWSRSARTTRASCSPRSSRRRPRLAHARDPRPHPGRPVLRRGARAGAVAHRLARRAAGAGWSSRRPARCRFRQASATPC